MTDGSVKPSRLKNQILEEYVEKNIYIVFFSPILNLGLSNSLQITFSLIIYFHSVPTF